MKQHAINLHAQNGKISLNHCLLIESFHLSPADGRALARNLVAIAGQLESPAGDQTPPRKFGFGLPLPETVAQSTAVPAPSLAIPLPGASQADPDVVLPPTPQTPNELLNSVYVDDEFSHRILINGVPFNLATARSYVAVLNAMIDNQVKRTFANDKRPEIVVKADETECLQRQE